MNRPFICTPSGKDYIWGGRKLQEDWEKEGGFSRLAESWECSTHPDGLSTASGGAFAGMELREILKLHPEYLGSHVRNGRTPEYGKEAGDKYSAEDGQIPILVKFIDAKQDLSVQVHPTDEFAGKFENGQQGKTELW